MWKLFLLFCFFLGIIELIWLNAISAILFLHFFLKENNFSKLFVVVLLDFYFTAKLLQKAYKKKTKSVSGSFENIVLTNIPLP